VEKGKFYFPDNSDGSVEITEEQLDWLLNSFDHAKLQHKLHKKLSSFY